MEVAARADAAGSMHNFELIASQALRQRRPCPSDA